MKKLLNVTLLIPLAFIGCYSTSQIPSRTYDTQADNAEYETYSPPNYENNNAAVSYQVFYDQLQPYGNWINFPGHGYVWQPHIQSGFRPYETNGRWISTVDGWAWSSNYSWGWAPFHYGRWLNDDAIGWLWVPGYEWAPAWVTWGSYNDYYAWAPLAPGISISIGRSWRAPVNYWSCIPRNRFYHSNFNRYIVRPDRYNKIENNITVINNYNTYNTNYYYNKGPEYREVEQYSGRRIRPVAIAPVNAPGITRVEAGRMQIYRPQLSGNPGTTRAIPSKISTLEEVKADLRPRREVITGNQQDPSVRQDIPRSGGVRDNTINRTPTDRSAIERSADRNDALIDRRSPNYPHENNNPAGNSYPVQPTTPRERVESQTIRRDRQIPATVPATGQSPIIRSEQIPDASRPERIERRSIREQTVGGNNSGVITNSRPNDNRLPQMNTEQNRGQRVFQGNRNATPPPVQQPSISPNRTERVQPSNSRSTEIQRPERNDAQRRGIVRPRQ